MREVESRRRIDDEVSEQAQAARGAERKILLNLSRLAQTGGQQQAALNAVLKCQNLADPSDHEVAIAFASVLWLSHESDAALRTLGSLLSTSAQSMGPEAHAEVLAVMVR